jgi:tetratricopeptide (TPR) repeat protein
LEPYLTGPRSQLANALQARLEEQARAGEATSEQIEAFRQESHRLYSEEAENLARDTILVPQDATTRYRYASVLILLKRYDEAEEVYREVCRLNPQAYEPHLALALLFEKQEKWDAALDVLELIDELRPNDRNVAAIRARIRAVRPPRGREL